MDLQVIAGRCSVLVTPALSASGLADMLVCLGSAGIVVRSAEPHPELPGSYELILTGNVKAAGRTLAEAGCTLHRLVDESVGL